jgi:hypothetical protein
MEGYSSGTSTDKAIKLLRELPPREQLKVIVEILPELEMMLSESLGKPRRSLLGLCADLGRAPSAEEIDEARKGIWAEFPRETA